MKYWEIVTCKCACHKGGRCGGMCAGIRCQCGLQSCGTGTIEHVIQELEAARMMTFATRPYRPLRKVIILNDRDSSLTQALGRKRFISNKEEDWLKK